MPCMQREPNSVALRAPFHLGGARGGFHRRSRTGGLANGMPRKAEMVPSDLPSSSPVSILTVGAEPAARMLMAASSAVKIRAPVTAEKPTLIEESPVESRRDNITAKGSAKIEQRGRVIRWNSILDVVLGRGLGSNH